MKLKTAVESFLVFAVLVTLITTFWASFRVQYSVIDTNTNAEGQTIFEKLNTLTILEGINTLTLGIQEVTTIGNGGDLLGGLALSGAGISQVIGGIVLFPFQITGIITGFYPTLIPPIFATLLGVLVVLGIGFILLAAKMGFDL